MSNRLVGVLVPAVTPFDSHLRPQQQAFVKHCRWLLDHGADGLAVFGTTSEANSMSVEERIELLDLLVDEGFPPDKLLPGTGACALTDSLRLTRHAVDHGCAGVLMLPPFYYKGVSEEGLYASFSQIIERIGEATLRIYLYHIPPMSQVPISIPLLERLVTDYPSTVVGVKDSGGDWDYTSSLLQTFPDLSIFPGSELFLLDGLRNGSSGCITASGNINPAAIKMVFEHWREPEADDLQARISAVRNTVQSYPMIPALKAIISDLYQDPDWLHLRPPLSPLPQPDIQQLMARLAKVGFDVKQQARPSG